MFGEACAECLVRYAREIGQPEHLPLVDQIAICVAGIAAACVREKLMVPPFAAKAEPGASAAITMHKTKRMTANPRPRWSGASWLKSQVKEASQHAD
jgi:hypothetical protein